jgi:hypothetical protein
MTITFKEYTTVNDDGTPHIYNYGDGCIYQSNLYQCTNLDGHNGYQSGFIAADFTLLSDDVNVNTIELDLKLTSSLNRYKVFGYDSNGNIISQNIYADNTMANQFYGIVYNYTGSNLSSIVVTRTSDSFSYTKTFTYDSSNNLLNINIT